MPNWCETDLTITGPNLKELLAFIHSPAQESEESSAFDFNKILPYPEEYAIQDKKASDYNKRRNALGNDQFAISALEKEFGVDPGTVWMKDGYNTGGYEWCNANWGTKWNASNVSLDTAMSEDIKTKIAKVITCGHCQTPNKTKRLTTLVCVQCGAPLVKESSSEDLAKVTISFSTAWRPPIEVIEKLASLYPDNKFVLDYYEMGMGFQGHACWENGEESYHNTSEYSGNRGG